jgi:phage shock protein PspC (stress-responsive transcriptional regulator)
MTKETIIRKLTSRKLWVAVAGFVSGLIVAFDGDAETAETISGLILQGASVLAYIIAEGITDAANTK